MKPERLGTWEAFDAPAAIADRIGEVWLSTHRSAEPVLVWRAAGERSGRPDVLHCFEGLTGQVWKRGGHGSFLGYVLVRDLRTAGAEEDDYDVHVVFRGSRSGWVVRSAVRGFVAGQGNPDWTTAMDLWRQVEDPSISGTGRSSRGFARSMAETLPNIARCLDAIDRPGPPRAIHVSGHSLGGPATTSPRHGAGRSRESGGPVAGDAGWRSWPGTTSTSAPTAPDGGDARSAPPSSTR